MNKSNGQWKGEKADEVAVYDATQMLNAPFKVLLRNSVKQLVAKDGTVIETFVPDPLGLIKAVAQARALHPHKLDAKELKFIRSALGLKSFELAEAIAVSPEHLSRVEGGKAVLSPQSEMLVRIFTYITSLPEHPNKNVTLRAKQVGLVFGAVNIKSCHSIDDEIIVTLSRTLVAVSDGQENDETWDNVLPFESAA
jgi:DNA-binding transcriptional regulator YiaG